MQVLALTCAVAALTVPTLDRRVTDQAGVLSASDAARIDGELAQYEQSSGHQFAVLIVPSLQGDSLEDFSIRTAEQWRLGDKKRDDGLLMVIAMQERVMRVEVGYGLEGAVPDVVASRVIRDVMAPKMRANDVAGAVSDGLHALMRAAQGESLGPAPSNLTRAQRGRAPFSFGFVFGLAMLFMFVSLALPRLVRAPLFALVGAVVGYALVASIAGAIVLAVIGGVLGVVLPRSSHHGGGGGAMFLLPLLAGGMRGGRGWSSGRGGFGGGFGGGGGRFGGGGASGRW
jgi:uncharacterized protein